MPTMPRIAAVATASPPYRLRQCEAREMARAFFAPAIRDVDRYLGVFANAEIDTRALAVPPEWFLEPHGWGECNDRWIEVARDLGAEAARRCLDDAGLGPQEVDHLLFVSTTGLAAPSIDARIMTDLGMRPHTRRTPIWGLGCAGGAVGLARAAEYARAFPRERALLVCVELCSLTFQFDDRSVRNLVAASLFADGAAAVLVEGDAIAGDGPAIVGSESTLFPDSLDLMGWDIGDGGMRVVFGARIPCVVTEHFRPLAENFLERHNLALDCVEHHIAHPGGAKVLAAYEQAGDLRPAALAHSRAVLRQCGNMSSATVLYVLQRFLRRGIAPGEHGLLTVFGPGFSSEMVLLAG
jgi:alkylresorcinol/alkylpyrone synthase